jgi:hypothetical protein
MHKILQLSLQNAGHRGNYFSAQISGSFLPSEVTGFMLGAVDGDWGYGPISPGMVRLAVGEQIPTKLP